MTRKQTTRAHTVVSGATQQIPTNGTVPARVPVDAGAEFEAAIARLKELTGSTNEQVAVKAAADLARILKSHVALKPLEPEPTQKMRDDEMVSIMPDYLALIAHLVQRKAVEPSRARQHLAPLLRALDDAEQNGGSRR